jgi:shikimate dehydrogenase
MKEQFETMPENTKYFFIAGNPVLHSKSPQLFDAFAKDGGLRYSYVKALCKNAADIKLLLDNGFSGGNITAPLKEEVLKLAFDRSQVVQRINAANLDC